MISNEEELVRKLGEDLIEPLKNYRTANIVGGNELAQKVCFSLMEHTEEPEYKLVSAFEYLADQYFKQVLL